MTKQMQMFFENRQIEIAGRDGTIKVSAEIIGQVAVHPTPVHDYLWTITHVQSGYALLEGIYEYVAAIAIAEAMKALDIDAYWHHGCCASQAFYDEATRLIKTVAAKYNLRFGYRIVGEICEDKS